MVPVRRLLLLFYPLLMPVGDVAAAPASYADLLAHSAPSDWRSPDPRHTLYMELPAGRVIIELAPGFAPLHVENIERLVHEHFYDALSIIRVQDNYVVQWGDPDHRHPSPAATRPIPPEFDRRWAADIAFAPLPDGDVYAPQAGFSAGLPVAGDRGAGRLWLTHCYGMVGVGRDDDPTSGSGAELYVVIGHAPRQLDRNVALVGRVLKGIEYLSSLPRGSGPMGFYERPEQTAPIRRILMETDVPASEREHLQVLRTDTPTFAALVENRRNRRDGWFARPAGRIELCNVPLPVREAPTSSTPP